MSMYCCVGHLTWSNGASRSLKVYVYIYTCVISSCGKHFCNQTGGQKGSEQYVCTCLQLCIFCNHCQSLFFHVWLLSETIVPATRFDSQKSLPQPPKKLLSSFLLVFLGVSGYPQAPQKTPFLVETKWLVPRIETS